MAATIFKLFMQHKAISNLYDDIVAVHSDSISDIKKVDKIYVESVQHIINQLSQDVHEVDKYNYMVEVLTDDNLFDESFILPIVVHNKLITIKLLNLFESITAASKSHKNVNIRTSENQSMSKKAVAATGGSIGTVVIIVLVVLLVLRIL